jgi:hypothetical protein
LQLKRAEEEAARNAEANVAALRALKPAGGGGQQHDTVNRQSGGRAGVVSTVKEEQVFATSSIYGNTAELSEMLRAPALTVRMLAVAFCA